MAPLLDKASIVRHYLYSKQHIPTVRIAVLGCEGIGKRSILQRFCYGSLIEQTRNSLVELEWHKHIAVQGRDVHVQFDLMSDAPLQMKEEDLLEYIQVNEAYMLVYDVTDLESFEVLEGICRVYAQITRQQPWRTPFFIVASKIDRWRGGWAVPYLKGDEFARSVGATFLSMSALNGEGTGDEVIVDVVSRVLLSRYQNEVDAVPWAQIGTLIPQAVSPTFFPEKPVPKARSIRPSIWQRVGLLRLLHRSGRLLDWLKPKQGIHHWDQPTVYTERNDSLPSMAPPVFPSEQQRTRSLTSLNHKRSRELLATVDDCDQPPMPPSRFGDPVRLNRAGRHSRTMSLEVALGQEFFHEAHSQTPVR